jgi:ribosomal protein S18 acetylase RimI-like enzyme
MPTQLPTIRPAHPAEYPTIELIAHATWPSAYGDILTPEQISYMLDLMYSPAAIIEQVASGQEFYVLETIDMRLHEKQLVGYVSHQFDYLPGTTKIHKLYALPAVQGKGYGRLMIDHVAAQARAAGQQKLRLDVNYKNRALGFYEKLGFQKTERCNTDIGNGYLMEDWVMEMEL